MSGLILHLAERLRWQAALGTGSYLPTEFDVEGCIHCSEPHQLEAVADLLFRGREGLVILAIEESRLTAEVRRENLEGGDNLFPHICGPVDIEAVVSVHRAPPGADGRLDLPTWLSGPDR